MWYKQIIDKLPPDETYSRTDLYQSLKKIKPGLNYGTFQWLLYKLQQEKILFRVRFDTYSKTEPVERSKYIPLYSKKALNMIDLIGRKYPLIQFMVFESVLLNEFLNHQIAQNTIFLQVDKEISSFVFDMVHKSNIGNVLYKPQQEEFNRYWMRNCIVVLDLVSQAPINIERPHHILVEKMLVDILADKLISRIYSPAERPFIFKNAMRSYWIDTKKMLRYAGRRNRESEIKKYIELE